MQNRKNHCIAVIGDGAITGGMAYEAMNHAGFLDKNMIVILNDNQQVRLITQQTDVLPASVKDGRPAFASNHLTPSVISTGGSHAVTAVYCFQTVTCSLSNMR